MTPANLLHNVVSLLEKEAQDPWKLLRLTIRISAFCMAVSFLLSYSLWFQDGRVYLPSPVVPWLNDVPRYINQCLYLTVIAISVLLFIFPQLRRIGLLLPPVFVYFVLQDQLRGQFFLYLYLFNLFVAAALPRQLRDEHLDPLRYMTIGVYFWAGFYKINVHFMNAVFPWFVSPWLPDPGIARALGALAPLVELGIGLLLVFPPSRRIGQALACVMLITVLLSLGPLGHNQAMTVWPTNVYLDSLAVFLFMTHRRLFEPATLKKPLALVAVVLFMLVPSLGMANQLGPHPVFKLYCCVHMGEIRFAKGEDFSKLPEKLAVEAHRRNRLASSFITFAEFEVCSGTLLPGDRAYLDAMKGFCPRLRKPEQARLRITETTHFWSDEVTIREYDLCAPDPKLLNDGKTKNGAVGED